MRWKQWGVVISLPSIGADGFRPETPDVTLFNQKPDTLGRRPWRMRAVLAHVQVLGSPSLGPVRSHQHPGAGGDLAMLDLPGLDDLGS